MVVGVWSRVDDKENLENYKLFLIYFIKPSVSYHKDYTYNDEQNNEKRAVNYFNIIILKNYTWGVRIIKYIF